MTARKIGLNTWAVPSQTTPDMDHVVKLVDGRMTCSCEWGYWKASDCFHIKQTRALLIVESLDTKSTADAKRRDLGLYLLTGGRQGSAA